MQIADKVVIVTGGANGIGRALSRRFAAEHARAVIVADLDADVAAQIAHEIGGVPFRVDVTNEADIIRLVKFTEEKYGAIDLFCSNAGIMVKGGVNVTDEDWKRIWDVNVHAHILAARAVLPGMISR